MRDAKEIVAEINSMDIWDFDLCRELCELAGMLDEWKAADGENFESVLYEAAKKLNVEIK